MTCEPWRMKEKKRSGLKDKRKTLVLNLSFLPHDRCYSSISMFPSFVLFLLYVSSFFPRTNFHAGSSGIRRDNLCGIWGSEVIRAKLAFSTKSSRNKMKPGPPLFGSTLKGPVKAFSRLPRPPLPSWRLWGIQPVKPTVVRAHQREASCPKLNWKANNNAANKHYPSCWFKGDSRLTSCAERWGGCVRVESHKSKACTHAYKRLNMHACTHNTHMMGGWVADR